jgi:putative copper resistance protein D
MATGLAWLVRGTGFVALAGLVGGFVVDLVVLPSDPPTLAGVRRRLRAVRLGCATVLLLSAGGDLLLRAATMSDGGLGAVVPAIPVVLTRTHFGRVWVARAAGLLLLLPLSVAASRRWRGLGALVSLGIGLTLSLTGHADDWGDVSATAGLDWVHVVAATTWTGGLLVLAGGALAEAAHWPVGLLPVVMHRFSRLAAWCLLGVMLSGVYRAWVELTALAELWRTPYGRALTVKLLLVLGLVWCGAINRYLVLPRLGAGRTRGAIARVLRLGRLALSGPSRLPQPPSLRLAAYVRREAVLALLIFGCTAVLVESTPARHGSHHEHGAAWDEPMRVTMTELHAAGGVPRGWSFRPPPGDAARGRQVFLRLGCFACHRATGDDLPPSAGIGPDLAGVGDHHPAGYLLESVINPNAVIVLGPGYTGPDGRSLMPGFADRLTVEELLDLVAYLRTL